MPKLPRVKAPRLIRVLEKAGFVLDRQKGSHQIFLDSTGRRVVVPVHAGNVLRPKTLKSILRDARLSVAEFARLLSDL